VAYHKFRFGTTLTLDPRNDTLAVRGRAGKATVARADIVAVQVCCMAAETESVGTYWEVILVVADPHVRRILLMAYSRPDRARAEALVLASFLGVAPLDHAPRED